MDVMLQVPGSLTRGASTGRIFLKRELGDQKTINRYDLTDGKFLTTGYGCIDSPLIVGRIVRSPRDIEK